MLYRICKALSILRDECLYRDDLALPAPVKSIIPVRQLGGTEIRTLAQNFEREKSGALPTELRYHVISDGIFWMTNIADRGFAPHLASWRSAPLRIPGRKARTLEYAPK